MVSDGCRDTLTMRWILHSDLSCPFFLVSSSNLNDGRFLLFHPRGYRFDFIIGRHGDASLRPVGKSIRWPEPSPMPIRPMNTDATASKSLLPLRSRWVANRNKSPKSTRRSGHAQRIDSRGRFQVPLFSLARSGPPNRNLEFLIHCTCLAEPQSVGRGVNHD